MEASDKGAAAAAAAAAAEVEAGKVVAQYKYRLNDTWCTLSVQVRDLKSLEAGNWLSDTIIQLGVQSILEEVLGEQGLKRVGALDALFSFCLRQVCF